MAQKAYDVLSNPQIRKLRTNELEVLEQAKKQSIRFEGFDIQTYEWGNPEDESVLLIHGWEGQAGNFSDLVGKLLEHSYHVVAFDGPSHGFSSKGQTSLFEFIDLVAEMIKRSGVKKLVSHSFGGVATTGALYKYPELEIDKYVLLTVPDKFSQRINDVARQVGVTERVKLLLIDRLEQEMNQPITNLNVSEFVKTAKVREALIIHDKNDRVIPIAQAKHVLQNWTNCTFKEIEGTGHFRILRTEFVQQEVLNFLT
ncbi:MAG: alpha/beta hydrolase [Bacteroidota bacterium]